MIKKLAKEPLVHFLIVGAAIFIIDSLFNEPGPDDTEIMVTVGEIESMAEIFQRTWQRPPTANELNGVIQDRIREEIFYREALALGLDKDDTIIRRRLRQKIQFLTDDLTLREAPDDSVLQAYLDENLDTYRAEPQVSFEQLYFSRDRRGAEAETAALAALELLNAGDDAAADAIDSDSLSLAPTYAAERQGEIDRIFGVGFAEQLLDATVGAWSGPHESGYGLHIAKVMEVTHPEDPKLDAVRDAVLRDWQQQTRQQANEAFYEQLKKRYTIVTEYPEWAVAAMSGVDE